MSFVLLVRNSTRALSSSSKKLKSDRTKALLDRIIRVDHAGEYGAVRIYEGQLAVLGRTEVAPIIKEMLKEEEKHLSAMKDLVPQHRARPTIMIPIWNVAGFVLGASTALLGKEAAMACTVAVETVIGEHYDGQLRNLMADGPDGLQKHKELIELLSKFRDEELVHLDTGLENNAEQAQFYDALSQVIKLGCRGAIWLSERI